MADQTAAQPPQAAEPDLFADVRATTPAQPAAQQTNEPDLFADVKAAPAASNQPQPSGEPNLFADVRPLPGQAPAPASNAPNADAQAAAQALIAKSNDPFAQAYAGPFNEGFDTDVGLGVGLAKGAFAIKDFFATGAGLFGEPPKEQDRSQLRQTVDAVSDAFSQKDGLGYSFAEGTAQAAVGLLGVSKLQIASTALKTGAAAVATAASFEPHAANFANLAERIPGMNGPIVQLFASSDDDSAFKGYVKNALVSLGVEGTAAALFTASAGLLKALRGGDAPAIDSARTELQQALDDHTAAPSPKAGDGIPPAQPAPAPSPANETPVAPPAILAPAEATEAPAAAPQLSEALPTAPRSAPALPAMDDESINRILSAWGDDQQALMKWGSWDAAVANGHTFGGGDKIPWQLLARGNDGLPETSMDAFMARIGGGYAKLFDDVKGGAVQTDAMNAAAVNARLKLWNDDPSELTGALQAAGERAGSLRADMMASFAVAQRCMQDTWTMASRINIGDLSDWGGSRDAALAALKQQTGVAASLLASAQSIRSNAARAMRGMRQEFALDPTTIRSLSSLDGDSLVSMLTTTKGDPMALKAALQPRLMARLADKAQLYLVNNLISNPITHAFIFGSNFLQATTRPAMRMAGSLANGTWDSVGLEAAKSYSYLRSSIPDAFKAAVDAFRTGDSIISPRDLRATAGEASGGAQAGTRLGQAIAQAQYRPWNNVGDILSNLLLAGAKTGSFFPRAVGFQDELVKQVVYRAKVQARAAVDGAAQGMTGDDLAQYVKGKLYSSFDSYGRATDMAALNEAKIATFQNDLNPTGNSGWDTGGAITQRALANFPPGRVILPFIRTPVNLFRQGIQLTPPLNLAQKEFRDALFGKVGPEQQAQAVGQMGMGLLLMGTAATLADQGLITGAAPSDPKLAAEAMADGWRPYSIVIPHADGSRTYIPFDRLDPIMMPFATAANIVNVLKQPEMADQNKAESMIAALTLGTMRQLADKLYLQHVKQTVDFLFDPEHSGERYLGGIAANYVPFASLVHLVNPDPIMREAHDFVSTALNKVPGLSATLPARRDWAGDAITVHKVPWVDAPGSVANAEVQRLALQQGASIGAPGAKARGGADLRGLTLAGDADPEGAGKNAYDRFQELAGHPERMPGAPANAVPLRDAVTRLIQDPRYAAMPDGAPAEPGTKIAALMDIVRGYRKGALAFIGRDSNVRAAEYAETMRVAKANGYVMPDMPTQANQTSGFLSQLGKVIGGQQ